jgi:hypothetical protein
MEFNLSRIVQEKFQVVEPLRPKRDHRWASDKSARVAKGEDTLGTMYNRLPPGMNIEDQDEADIQPQDMAATLGVACEPTVDVTAKSLREGFDRKRMRPTDDAWTREHNDAFYDEISVDGVTGFVERNNMMDRE